MTRVEGRLPIVVAALLITAAAVVAYHRSFRVPFLLDDASAITSNPSIEDIRNPGAVFAPRDEATTAGRPLLNLSFALNYAFHGHEVFGYHGVNVALHTGAALLLFGIVRRALRARARSDGSGMLVAATVALVWVVHPVHTASVTYLSQRAEVLMAFWFLLTLYAFARSRDAGAWRGWQGVAVMACGAGMMSKETMVTAPVAVLLFDATFFASGIHDALRRRRTFYAALAGTWVILAALMWGTRVTLRGIGYTEEMSLWTHGLTQARVLCAYLKLSFWPHPLVFDYGPEIAVTRIADVWVEIAVLVAGSIAVVRLVRRAPAAGYGVMWFFLTLAPTIAVPVTLQPMAENRLYLPLAGMTVFAVTAIWRACRGGGPAASMLVIVALGALSMQRNEVFLDAAALWRDTVAKRPENARARTHLGDALRANGDVSGAIAEFETALTLNPKYASAHNSLGLIYSADPATRAKAIAHFEQALRLNPQEAVVHSNLALVLAADPATRAEAMSHLEQALRLEPTSAHLHNNMGVALAQMAGREDDAVRHYREAIRLRPSYPDAHKNLANVLVRRPEGIRDAIREYAEVLRLTPNDPDAHANLAFGLMVGGRHAEARQHFESALRLNPRHAHAHANLGNLLMQNPAEKARALAHYRQAVTIAPHLAEVWANLGIALSHSADQREEARSALERALQLRPDLAGARSALERMRAAQ